MTLAVRSTPRPRRLRRVLGAAVAVAFAVAGCGGTPPSSALGSAASSPSNSPAANAATPDASVASPSAAPSVPGAATATPEATQRPCATDADGYCVVRWFAGLSPATSDTEAATEAAVAAAFNASETSKALRVRVRLEAASAGGAGSSLAQRIAAGDPPEIVGPADLRDLQPLRGNLVDLSPLMDRAGYDRSAVDPAVLRLVTVDGGAPGGNGPVLGLPSAVFPSVLFYNEDLFRQRDLKAPPHRVGEPYAGAAWDVDALATLARKLTIDQAGRDALDPSFDPGSVVQWGFDMPGAGAQEQASLFGPGSLVSADGHSAVIPAEWRAAWRWWYDATWQTRFVPSPQQAVGEALGGGGGGEFASGHLAMALATWRQLATLRRAGSLVPHWNLSAPPAYAGRTTTAPDVEAFAMLAGASEQDRTFAVLSFLAGSKDLLRARGGMPVKTADRAAYLEDLAKSWPGRKIDWAVGTDSLARAPFQAMQPAPTNADRANRAIAGFTARYRSQPGLDVDAEIDRLARDLDAAFAAP